ncbi:hypothetical protein [Phytoactinopolyspora mesophila]|uniref:ASCH domain-containing protein n=1 Tax=Phytoactinopolyspora mesophila TaxID=2650750 RepID=A0A7K3M8E9_9ACTN|nr:hypothetical protein [Phytoactinopolyspora mesophila]NDL59267.1 hypothetical protein [Phytoactinopolyspora mesophila]
MLFEKRFWAGIADGSVTVTFRRWKRAQVLAGRSYRSAAGMLDVVAVDVVDTTSISDDDAVAAGYPDAAALVADLRGEAGQPVYRIRFRLAERPDPRAELAADAELDESDVAEIDRRLDRLDRASKHGAWTRPTMRLIAQHPERRAGDLAEMMNRERADFKLDVRKLKNLGLTESLSVGYRLSPRGMAYLARAGSGENG